MAYFQSEDGFRCLDRPILLYTYAIIGMGHGDHKLEGKWLIPAQADLCKLDLSSRQSPSFKKIVWSSGVHRGMEIFKIVIFLSPLRNCLPCAVSHNMAYPNNEEFE